MTADTQDGKTLVDVIATLARETEASLATVSAISAAVWPFAQAEAKAENARLRQELADANADSLHRKIVEVDLRKELAEAFGNLDAYEAECVNLNAQIEDLATSHGDLEGSLTAARRSIEGLRARMVAAEAQRDSLAARLAEAEKVVEAAKAWAASIEMTQTPAEADLALALLAQSIREDKANVLPPPAPISISEPLLILESRPIPIEYKQSDIQVLGDQVLVGQPKEGDRGSH